MLFGDVNSHTCCLLLKWRAQFIWLVQTLFVVTKPQNFEKYFSFRKNWKRMECSHSKMYGQQKANEKNM